MGQDFHAIKGSLHPLISFGTNTASGLRGTISQRKIYSNHELDSRRTGQLVRTLYDEQSYGIIIQT